MIRTLFVCLLAIMSTAAPAEEWTQFRGPNQDGSSSAASVPTRWTESGNVAWKTELPGRGWSSPGIAGGKIWLTTAVEREATAAELEQLLAEFTPEKRKQRQAAGAIRLMALRVDLESGELEKQIELATLSGPDAIHSLNSYASPTPTLDGDRLFCDFGAFGTFAVDLASGEAVWKRKLEIIHNVGPGSSPILVGSLLILVRDGVDFQYVTALDKHSGETVWKTDRPPMRAANGAQKKAYSTPLLIEHAGREQLVIPTSQWIVAYEPASGAEIWRVDHGNGFSLVPQPVFADGMIFAPTGFGNPQLWAVRVDGRGAVTESHVAWKATKRIPDKPSPIVTNGRVFVIEDSGIVSCFDAATGREIWVDRLAGGNYSASPILVGGRIYAASQGGKISVFSAADHFELIAENEIACEIMASPVPIEGGLLLRSKTALYRIE